MGQDPQMLKDIPSVRYADGSFIKLTTRQFCKATFSQTRSLLWGSSSAPT